MTNEEIFSYIDHTLLKPTATYEQIKKLCEEALACHTASVCIPPSFVARVKKDYPKLTICTVIGFPNGYNKTSVKEFEARQAISDGADEIDMVINQGDVKEGNFIKVKEEIECIKKACGNKLLKVIIETCNLTEGEKIAMCQIVTEAGADYIKTSTGFGSGGATTADIKLFRDMIGENVKMKAAGGVSSQEDLEEFIALGCSRIGTSSAVSLLLDKKPI